MIDIFYAAVILLIAAGFGALFLKKSKVAGVGSALIIAAIGYVAYIGYFENIFARKWGGTLDVKIQENHLYINSTWKENDLWLATYDPESRTCVFQEYSRSGLLEGKVKIKNCNPIQLSSK